MSDAFAHKFYWILSHLFITIASMVALRWWSRLRCHGMTTCCWMHCRSCRRRPAFQMIILGSLFRSYVLIHSFWLHLRHFFGFCSFFANHRLYHLGYDLLRRSVDSFCACEMSLLELYIMIYAFLAGAFRLLDCNFGGHFFNHDFAWGLLNWHKLRLVLLELEKGLRYDYSICLAFPAHSWF